MPKKRAQDFSAATLATVSQLIRNVSVASVKSWLKTAGLMSSANTRVQLEKRVAALIDSGELSLDRFREVVIGIEESGGKTVHLFEVEGEVSATHIKAALKNAGITLASKRDFAARSAKTTLVYAMMAGDALRMKWSEEHERPQMDLDTLDVRLIPVKKVVVFHLHTDTGRAEIHYDGPESRHPHGPARGHSSPQTYFDYYRNSVEQLLGIKFVRSELRGVLKQLIEETPAVAEVKIQDHTNAQGNRIRVTAQRNDVRQDQDWQAMHSQNGEGWAYDSHSFYWIPNASNGRLKRSLFSALDADEGFIRVKADCSEEELTYATQQVRGRQKKAS
jgi:hypothetical protein